MLHSHKKGNALVDLIIAMIILGLVSISVVGAYTSLMSMASNSFRNSQASWMGNSVMEIYSAKAFDDIVPDNSFTLLDQFPNYTANIAVAYKDVNLLESEITDGNINSNYKEITAVISGQGVDDILTYTTLRSDCNEEGPILTSISTDYLSGQNSVPRFASSPNEVIIKLHFNSAIDVSNPQNIVLDLNVTERTEGDDGYYDVLEIPASTITVTGGILDDEKRILSFTYDVNPNHTSWTLTEWLDVLAITLNEAKITGSVGGMSDGCLADISLPTEVVSTLAANEVIIRVIPTVYYIFTDWGDLQNAINPGVEGSGLTAPTPGDIFDNWKRFDGNNVYNSLDDVPANSNARKWTPIYDDITDNLESFYMWENVAPPSGFVSPESYEILTLETTLYSQYPRKAQNKKMRNGDDDMIGVIVAYEQGTDLCNNSSDDHDPATCSNQGGTQHHWIIAANRTGGGVQPTKGWGLVYGKTGDTNPAIANATMSIIDDYDIDNKGNSRIHWHGKFTRVKIDKNNNIITAYSTEFLPWQDDDNNSVINSQDRYADDKTASRNYAIAQPYEDGDAILTVDLTSNRKYHKFVNKTGQDPEDTGSPFGFITYSQPEATYFDNVIPEPEVQHEVETGYIVYFNDRDDTNGDKTYVTWDPFDLEGDDEANERGINSNAIKSGIWKWIENDWIFQEGISIQDLNGFYGTITPNEDLNSDPIEENGLVVKYYIKKENQNQ
tara:strand:+ start:45 stop:2219 length:2175 start_codon:yes stop_codon:yes gene_type:complete